MPDDTIALLSRLTDYAQQNEAAIEKVATEVERMREERLKPYFTTMGAFLALFVAAVSYIYSMEQRLTDGFFAIQSAIHEVKALERINRNSILTLDERLEVRSDTMRQRWAVHSQDHEHKNKSRELMAREILDLSREIKKK